MYNAIKAGYRLLDGAGDYGNEREAGEGVKRAIKDGLVKREDLCEHIPIFQHRLHTKRYASHHIEGTYMVRHKDRTPL